MEKILVTSRIPMEGLKELKERFDVTYPDKEFMTREDIIQVAAQYDGIMAVAVSMDREVMDTGKKLKIISNFGAGYDNVDVPYATTKGIVVTNIPDSVTEATAELCFGLMVTVMRRIAECDRKLRQDPDFKWGVMKNLGHSVYGKTLGIIGMGRIGRAVARRARASGMKILYNNRKRLDKEAEDKLGAFYVQVDELLRTSDVISLNMPFTKETHHFMGERELGMMKPGAYLINTSRGPVVDEKALIDFIRNGRLAGAGLDVFEFEPKISPELMEMDQV